MSHSLAVRRVFVVIALIACPMLFSGCFFHDFDLETVDHYSHYGRYHSVDASYYSSDGCDY